MIAIDTNVLLRYLLWDNRQQAAKADRLINGDDPVLVPDVVLVETLWTLKGKKYQLAKNDLVTVLDSLFAEPNIHFEDDQAVWQALDDYRHAKPVRVGNKRKQADFADALIIHKARHHAARHNQNFRGMYTFDRAAQALPGATKAT